MRLIGTLVAVLLLYSFTVFGNDLAVANTLLGDQDLASNTQDLSFDLSWKNSWRTSTLESNHDAVWAFVKYRVDGTSDWHHATLVPSTSTQPSGSQMVVASDGKGVFVQRDADGIGDVAFNGCAVIWDRAADGVASSTIIEVCVIVVEMVYVPNGQYLVGDASQSPLGTLAAADSMPFSMDAESSVLLGGSGLNALYSINTSPQYVADDFSINVPQSLPAEFPKGVNEFYQMKYEVDQGLYVNMLNKLNVAQSAARYSGSASNGNTIVNGGPAGSTYSTDTPSRPCNFINWMDFAALADWTGLRPMSELEFEKACRGDRPAVSDEFAHGATNISTVTHVVVDAGLPNEAINNTQNGIGNFTYLTTQSDSRPLRVGIMAASAVNKDRIETGATRSGVMEMSGNVWETVVSIGSAEGRAFTAENGNGQLDATGNADVSTWPGTNAVGSGIRGGGFFSTVDKLRVSDRIFSNYVVTTREPDIGGRLVRSTY